MAQSRGLRIRSTISAATAHHHFLCGSKDFVLISLRPQSVQRPPRSQTILQETSGRLAASLPSTFNGIITRPKIAGSILRDDRFIVSAPNPTTTAGAAEKERGLNSYYGDGMQRREQAELH